VVVRGSPSGPLLFILVLGFADDRFGRVFLVGGELRDRLPDQVFLWGMRRPEGGVVSHKWWPWGDHLLLRDMDVFPVGLLVIGEVAPRLDSTGEGFLLHLGFVHLQVLLGQRFLVVVRVWLVRHGASEGSALAHLALPRRVREEVPGFDLHVVILVPVILLDDIEVCFVVEVCLDFLVGVLHGAEGLVVSRQLVPVLLGLSELHLAGVDVRIFCHGNLPLEM